MANPPHKARDNANQSRPLWRLRPSCDRFTLLADVAQLVARNLAKVQVAGSNPVVRSDVRRLDSTLFEDENLTAIFVWSGGREARQGTANPSTRVQIPFRPPSVALKEANFGKSDKLAHNLISTQNLIYLGRLAQR